MIECATKWIVDDKRVIVDKHEHCELKQHSFWAITLDTSSRWQVINNIVSTEYVFKHIRFDLIKLRRIGEFARIASTATVSSIARSSRIW